jgi:hypothetical protein
MVGMEQQHLCSEALRAIINGDLEIQELLVELNTDNLAELANACSTLELECEKALHHRTLVSGE